MKTEELIDQHDAQEHFLSTIKKWSWIVLAITSLIQLVFFFDIDLVVALVEVAFAWLLANRFLLNSKIISRFAISTFLILGFVSTQFYFPLIFTTIEGKSLNYNLEYPQEVFYHNFAALLILLIVHAIYRGLSVLSGERKNSLALKVGLFSPPSQTQLWIMGFIGIAATVYTYFTKAEVNVEVTGDPGDKLVQSLIPFSYAPFLIFFYKLYGGREVSLRRVTPLIVMFTLVLFAISMGRNSRGAFMFGFTSTAFAYALGLLLGVYENKLLSARNFAVGAALIWLLTGPVADLGTAMVIVRGDRGSMPANELLPLTLDTFFDKEAIRARREQDKGVVPDDGWDERYLDNIFTARFSNLKFNDLSLIQYDRIGEFDPDMQQYALDHIAGGFPGPVAKFLGLEVDKEAIYSMSTGDFIYLLAGGNGYQEGGFRVGHFAGVGMATFGWWYLAVLGVAMMPVFFLYDRFYKRAIASDEHGKGRELRFSCCGLLVLTSVFQFLPTESVVNLISFLLREWIQLVVLYLVIFYASKYAESLFTVGKRIRSINRGGA